MAPLHTAKVTKELLKKEHVSVIHWMPAGADVTPLDIFANNSLKAEVRGRDIIDLGKLKERDGAGD